jgi:putative transposase
MSTSRSKHFYHAIWGTKNSEKLILPHHFKVVEQSLIAEFIDQRCTFVHVKILTDHVHCLFEYNKEVGLPTILKNVKGLVSYKLNYNKLLGYNIYWEKGYDSYSVSPSSVKAVLQYLEFQESYHVDKSYLEEITEIKKSLVF